MKFLIDNAAGNVMGLVIFQNAVKYA